MDIWGIILFVIGLVGYFILRKRDTSFSTFFVWLCGVGVGIFIASIWAVLIVNRTLSGFGG